MAAMPAKDRQRRRQFFLPKISSGQFCGGGTRHRGVARPHITGNVQDSAARHSEVR